MKHYPRHRSALVGPADYETPGQAISRKLLVWALALAGLAVLICFLAGWVAPRAWAELHVFARELGGLPR